MILEENLKIKWPSIKEIMTIMTIGENKPMKINMMIEKRKDIIRNLTISKKIKNTTKHTKTKQFPIKMEQRHKKMNLPMKFMTLKKSIYKIITTT